MNRVENTRSNYQEFKENKTILKSYPQNIWLSVTNKCNLCCTHCKLGRPEKKVLITSKRADMSNLLFNKIKEQVFPYVERVIFGGNTYSEQLFAENWDDIFEQTTAFPIKIHITTNGSLLTKERVEKFIKNEVVLSVSIESIRPELYNKMRGDFYSKVFDLIKYACDLKKELKKDKAVINFGVTIFKDNIYEMPKMIELAARFGVTGINASHLCPQFENQREQSLVYHKDTYNQIYDISYEKAGKLGIKLDLPHKFYISKIFEKDKKETVNNNPTENFCPWPWKGASIDHEGRVTPCCGSDSLMGSLEKENFIDIWNGKKYQRLRETIGTENPPDYCRDCITRTNGQISNAKILSTIGTGSDFSLKRLLLLNLRDKMLKNSFTKPIYYVLEKVYKKIS